MNTLEKFTKFIRILAGKKDAGTIHDIQNLEQRAFLRNLQKRTLNANSSLHIPLLQLELVVFDIETTGFHPHKGDEIISIGAVKMKGDIRLEEVFYTLVKPEYKIPQHVVRLTGIDEEMVVNAPSLHEALYRFMQFTEGRTLVAHHANHERNFMNHYFPLVLNMPFHQRIVDTAFVIQVCERNNLSFITLDDVCQHHKIKIKNRHHALGDAKMTAILWRLYVQKSISIGCGNLNDIYERFSRI